MSAPTSLPDFAYDFAEINETSAPILAEVSLAGSHTFVLGSAWAGDITKAWIVGARTPTNKFMQIHIAAGGFSDTTHFTATTRPMTQNTSDIADEDTANDFDLPAGTKIYPVVSPFFLRYIAQAILGTIANGSLLFTIGDDTDSTVTIKRKGTGAVAGWLRWNVSTTKVQFSNDGTTWVNMDNAGVGVLTAGRYIDATALAIGTVQVNNNYALTTGSADAYVATITSTTSLYTTGEAIRIKANFTNTGAATIAVNGGAATSIKLKDGATDVSAGDIVSGEIYEMIYDGTNYRLTQNISDNQAKKPVFLVRGCSTANVTIATALNNGDTLDGLTLVTDDLVILTGQSAPAENGIYRVGATPARATDYNADLEIRQRMVLVQEGTSNAGKLFKNTNTSAITVDSTSITYSDLSALYSGSTTTLHSHSVGGALNAGNFTYTNSTASGTTQFAHGLGVVPRLIKFTFALDDSDGSSQNTFGNGHWITPSTSKCIATDPNQGTAYNPISDKCISLCLTTNGNGVEANVSAVDTTNVTLNWTKVGTPNGTTTIVTWEAWA